MKPLSLKNLLSIFAIITLIGGIQLSFQSKLSQPDLKESKKKQISFSESTTSPNFILERTTIQFFSPVSQKVGSLSK